MDEWYGFMSVEDLKKILSRTDLTEEERKMVIWVLEKKENALDKASGWEE